MGGCIRRLWKFIPDVDDSESDPICRKEDLTEYELALQKGLVRFGAVVLLCFFINLTLCIYDYESSGEYQDPQDFVISMVTLLPMVPQFAFRWELPRDFASGEEKRSRIDKIGAKWDVKERSRARMSEAGRRSKCDSFVQLKS